MKKKKAAIIGYGNIGKCVLESLQTAPDFEITGIVRRNPSDIPSELKNYKVVGDICELPETDVALLTIPSREVESFASEILAKGINTVDCFDIHPQINELHDRLNTIAQKNNTVSVISAGWDPGSDSVVRTLLEACAPKGITYTNFGPGMSMGHTVAVKAITGIKNALSMTIPCGSGIHRRMVYIELEEGYDYKEVCQKIKNDPYFINDETLIFHIESVDEFIDMGHGVSMSRKGVSGKTQNQLFEFNMKINNPALTAQIMVACARASFLQQPGCYTMIELPVINLLYGKKKDLIKRLV